MMLPTSSQRRTPEISGNAKPSKGMTLATFPGTNK
jgi:hypothetical protein